MIAIEMKICDRVYQAEKRNAEMLGHCPSETAMLALGAFCGVYSLAIEPDRPLMLTTFRPMR